MYLNRNIKRYASLLHVAGFIMLVAMKGQAQSVITESKTNNIVVNDDKKNLAPFFVPATTSIKAPNSEGFIQRWLLLEPISKSIKSNVVFTESFLKAQFNSDYFPNQFISVPLAGEKVKVAGEELQWHALESPDFNIKLFRFAYGLRKKTYGVLFWAVTVVNSPREMKNTRLAVGSNGGSMWWLNGQEAVLLDGDRRMVMDDCISPRLTLKKGKNIIRGAVINGPGLSDFCIRMLDEKGEPIKNVTIILQ